MTVLTEIFENTFDSYPKPNSDESLLIEYKKVETLIDNQTGESIKNGSIQRDQEPGLSFTGMQPLKKRPDFTGLESLTVAYYWSDYEPSTHNGIVFSSEQKSIYKYTKLTRSPIENMSPIEMNESHPKNNYLMYFSFAYKPGEIVLIERLRKRKQSSSESLAKFLKERSMTIVDTFKKNKELYLPADQQITIIINNELTHAQKVELPKWWREVDKMEVENTVLSDEIIPHKEFVSSRRTY